MHGSIQAWDSANGQVLFSLCGHSDPVKVIKVIKPDLIATGSVDTTIRLWKLASGECFNILKGHKATVLSIEYLNNGLLVFQSIQIPLSSILGFLF